MKKFILKILRIFQQFGINPLSLTRSLINIPFYIKSYFKFKKFYKGNITFYPCLNDRNEQAGSIKNEYFWQDLIIANKIYLDSPIKHVDIGSRLDGFIAHVASFREIEIFDLRPLSINIPNVIYKQADLMSQNFFQNKNLIGYCDSLSCLHAIEHFGLGRYGDSIKSDGFRVGIENMSKLLKEKGKFYLSTPIGKERVEFNANWIFDPRTVCEIAKKNGLKLNKFNIYKNEIGIQELEITTKKLDELAFQDYNLGLFEFIKTNK